MFHYKDGLFFGRNEDGSVKIRKMRDATGSAALVAEMDIDVDAWASIVAFVSAEGDRAIGWDAVREFHMEGILRAPAPSAPPLYDERMEALTVQLEKLSQFILNEVPGEPSENEGAVDTAVRLIRRSLAPLNAEAEQPAEAPTAPVPEEASGVVESPPPGAELEQPTEAPPEQPTEGEGKPPEAA